MRRQDLNRKLDQLHDAAERISTNLVELELDSTRQLLEASTLKGDSAARRSIANAALTELWRRHALLEELLSRADKLSALSRGDELERLLEERSIEIANSEVPITERDLLGSANADDRLSVDGLLASMSASFEDVKTVLVEIDRAWTTLTPKLDEARRTLQEVSLLSAEVGESDPSDLASVRKTASALTGAIATDPLSVDPADVDGLLRQLRATGQDLQSTIARKRGFDDRIAEARALLGQIQVAVGEAQAAHEEAQAKIADPQVPPPLEVDKGLDSDLDDIVELGRENAWRDATRALEDWRARANASLGDARRTLAVIRAPIETRNQYRAMLEAYQVKAERHGVLEDTELADVAARAAEALYTAPTDLALSAELIRSYQWAVNAAEGTPEATR